MSKKTNKQLTIKKVENQLIVLNKLTVEQPIVYKKQNILNIEKVELQKPQITKVGYIHF